MKLKGEIIILNKPGIITFKPTKIDTSTIGPNEVVARTLFSAISPGTETAAYSGAPALRPGKAYPRLLGYCNVAKILHTGKAVSLFKPGDIILTGESHRSIFITKEKDIFSKVPPKVDPTHATLTYIYQLGLSALRTINPNTHPRIAVIGLGVIGLGTLEQAHIMGLTTIALSNSQTKLRLAKKLGAKKVFIKNNYKHAKEEADLVVTTSNSWVDWHLALQLTKNEGTISVLGFPGRGVPPPDFNPLEPKYFYNKKIMIAPTGRNIGYGNNINPPSTINRTCEKILKSIVTKKLNPQNLISGIYDYKDIELAYKKLLSKDLKTMTYILKWPQ